MEGRDNKALKFLLLFSNKIIAHYKDMSAFYFVII